VTFAVLKKTDLALNPQRLSMKPKLSRRSSGVLFAVLAAGVLSACGGGDDDEPVPYGAIAYSDQTGKAAISVNHAITADAMQHALLLCGLGTDCRVVHTFSGKGTCGAIAGSRNGKVGAGSGPSRAEAESAALAQCNRNGGTACALSPALPAQCM